MGNHSLDLELFYDGGWHPAPVYERGGCTIMRGVTSPGSGLNPASAPATLDNHTGLYSPRSIVSPLYGKIGQNTSARLTVDGSVRLVGEVASWRPGRAIKNDAWTKIEVAGVLQRIGRGTDPIQSAITRATLALSPVAYWPLEAREGALTPGTSPLVAVRTPGITWAEDERLVGSLALPRLIAAAGTYPTDAPALIGNARGTSATGWSVGCWFVAETTEPSLQIWSLLTWGGAPIGSTTSRAWELSIANDDGTPANSGVFASMDGTDRSHTFGLDVLDGRPHHLLVSAEQTSANNVRIRLYIDGALASLTSTVTPYTLVPVDPTQIVPSVDPINPDLWIGHVSVFDRVLTAGEAAALYATGAAYDGETAADRFIRLCTEQGITPTVVGTAAESVAMGPQKPLPLLELFDEIGRTDDASIFETRSAIGLTMRTGVSKLNQAPDFTIRYTGEIVPSLVPVYGDEGIRNDVTATNPDSATRRVQQLTGPHNVQLPADDPQGVGRYQTRIDVNPETDDALSDAAGWRVNLGTFDGTWYAEITADLDAAPGITAAVNALDIGDVLAISNLPEDEALDTVESIIIGIKDDARPKSRKVTFFCIPAEPYRVGKLAATTGDTDPFVGHLDTDDTTAAAASALAASIIVATNAGPLWTTIADDFPFDVIVGGQRVGISAIASVIRSTFSGSAANGWDTLDSGQSWAIGAGTPSLFSESGGAGRIAVSALNTEHHIAVNVAYAPVQRVRVYQTLAVTPTGAAINWGVVLRRTDATNLYWIDVQVGTTGSLTLRVISKIGGVNTQLTTVVSATVHSTIVARILVAEIDAANIIRAKVYADGAVEPDWELVYDASAVVGLSSGPSVGCIARLTAGNTNAAPVTFVFDNFAVLNPQTMTVQPAGRQVRYPIPAGSAVNVQQPIILAL